AFFASLPARTPGVLRRARQCRSSPLIVCGNPTGRILATARQLLPNGVALFLHSAEDRSMNSKFSSRTLKFEQVENRICPAVIVDLASNGDLAISGDSAAAVVITALDADSYQVTEGATPIATINGVSRDIRIDLGGSS